MTDKLANSGMQMKLIVLIAVLKISENTRGRLGLFTILPQNALKRDCNGKCIERIEGHYIEVVVLL